MFRSPAIIAFAVVLSFVAQAAPVQLMDENIILFSPLSFSEEEYTVLGRDDTMSILGGEAGVPFGAGLASGDLDGDGRDDVIIGVPDSAMGPGGGAVLVYFAREPDELFSVVGHYDADLVILAEDEDDWFGSKVLVGDLNDDGRDDLMISAPFADGPQNTRRDSGEVYVISGRQRMAFGTDMEIGKVGLFAHIYGREGGDRLGGDIRYGDLNNDGEPELIVRTEGHGGMKDPVESEYDNECFGSWEIEIIEGDLNGIGTIDLSQTAPMVRYFGEAVTTADNFPTHIGNGLDVGDFDGDGIDDLAFSYRFEGSGHAVIMLGSLIYPGVLAGTDIQVHEGADFDPDVTIDLGSSGWEQASLTLVDLGSDTKEELVIGLPYAPAMDNWRRKAGQVSIFEGRNFTNSLSLLKGNANTTIMGIDSSDNLGWSTIGVDLDGDGIKELMVSVPGGDGVDNLEPNVGEAYVFDLDGSLPPLMDFRDADHSYKGRTPGSGAFWQMSAMEMLVDGYDELLISSPIEPVSLGSYTGTGLVSILSQKGTFEASFVGKYNASDFGAAMIVEDFDQDGNMDLVVGDPMGGASRSGYAHMMFGTSDGWTGRYYADRSTDIYYNDAVDLSSFGRVMEIGDLNDDGTPDLIIGAPEAQIDGYWNDAGSVHVYWGGSQSYMQNRYNLTYEGYSVERIGSAVAVGDYDGDGDDDLAFSATYDPGGQTSGRYHSGFVMIMFGPLSGTTIKTRNNYDVKIIGTEDNEFIGETLDAADIDGDGIDDLIIGAPKSRAGAITRQGVTYVLPGRLSWATNIDLVTEPNLRIFGPWPYDEIGSSLKAEDMDEDGKADLLLGSARGDGYQRTNPEGGNIYYLNGEFLASRMPSGNISLRNDYNISICGDEPSQRSGSHIETGDIDGDGLKEILIGAKGFRDQLSGAVTGAAFIFPNSLISDSLTINTSSLPVIFGFNADDEAGYALAAKDINSDGRVDLFIGAPGADPLGDGNRPGAVYYWEGKDLFNMPVRASQVDITNSIAIAGDLNRPLWVLAPEEGPYTFRMNARALGGYDEIDSVKVILLSGSASGDAELIFDTATSQFSLDATGDFQDQIFLDTSTSQGRNDAVQSWFLEFSIKVGWEMPDPDLIITEVTGTGGIHRNYLNEEFIVDREITLFDTSMSIKGDDGTSLKGWLKADTGLTVENISLYHGVSGIGFGPNASEVIEIVLERPDGIRISSTGNNGSQVDLPRTVPGVGQFGRDTKFTITNGSLPSGAMWMGDLHFTLDVDTTAPPPVSSFRLFPDGKESGIGDADDDQVIELYWENVVDLGGSGIANYTINILDDQDELVESYDQLHPGDLLLLGAGLHKITMTPFDRAGNSGPMENRSMLIDTEGPRFKSPIPGENSWVNGNTNSFSIDVTDEGSGFDPDTAQYRIYRSDVRLLSDWMEVHNTNVSGDQVTLQTIVPEADGYGHYIQWRIDDAAGQTSISLPYSYNMDSASPKIDLLGDEEITVGPEAFEIECYMEDELSGIRLDSIKYRIGSRDEFYDLEFISMGLTGVGASASPSILVMPAYRGVGFAQWEVTDVAGNTVRSDLLTIFIDNSFPVFTGFLPNGTGPHQKREVEITAFILDEGSGIDPDKIEYSISTISGWIQYGVGGFSPWEQVDEVEDRGGSSYAGVVKVIFDEGPFNLIKFRVMDRAGNGWVVSTSLTVDIKVTVVDLPPTATFAMYPATEVISKGESIVLDASSSFDPEGKNLTFTWYSDLENFPDMSSLGSGMMINVTLEKTGVHRLWVVISDGKNIVESEKMILNVEESSSGSDDGDENGSMWDWFQDWLPFLLMALLLGMVIGAVFVYFILGRRELEEEVPERQPLVPAHFESDFYVPKCPYCETDVKMSDEYCMKCGSVFSAEDKTKMEKLGKKRSKKKKKKHEALPRAEEEDLYSDIGADWEEEDYDEEELEDDFFASDVEDEEDLIPDEEDIEDLEEEDIEDYDEEELEEEDLEDLDLEEVDDDEDWEVS